MSDKNRTAVFGILAGRNHAEIAVDALVEAGFSAADISVLLPQGTNTRGLGILTRWGAPTIPGVGPIMAAGPLMVAIAGDGGATGGLLGALVGGGVPEYEAKRYQGRVRSGSVLISVHCPSSESVHTAIDVLEQTGAEDVDSAVELSSVAETGAFMQPPPPL